VTSAGHLLVGDIFRHAARAVPDRTAAVMGSASLTFADVQARADRVAGELRRLGIGRGDRIAVCSATNLDLVPLFAACAQVGAVFVPLNPQLGADETVATVAIARPSLIVADAERMPVARAAAEKVACASCGIDDLRDGGDGAVEADANEIGAGGSDAAPSIVEDDPHVLFFTSGSTGLPKGVVLSHRVNVLRAHPGAQFEPRGAAVCAFPLFHMAAWTIAMQQWQARDAVVFLASPTAEAICDAIERHRATRVNAVPAVWHRVLDHLDHLDHDPGARPDLSSLRFADTGTSATPPELLTALTAALPNARVRVFYGSTEAGNVTTLEHHDLARKPGRVGVPSLHTELRIDDAGELWVRGPLLFDGYVDDEQATSDALVDGWYRTGDLAELDDEGYVSIVGRARDVIRTGGETVAPAEVEAALATMASIRDIAVVGVPDPAWGEVVCAVVVVTGDAPPPSLEDLRGHCVGRLAGYKQPRRVVVVDEIPRTPTTGAVQRRLIVERLVANGG